MKLHRGESVYRGKSLGARGGVPFRVLLVLISLVIIGLSVALLLARQQKAQESHHRRATENCEYALQVAMPLFREMLTRGLAGIEDIPRTERDGGWYEVSTSVVRQDSTAVLHVESHGASGSVTVSQKTVIHLVFRVSEGDTTWVPHIRK